MAQGDPATIEGITAAWQETTEALRDSERRYRELVEYSLGLICTHDLTGTILSINPAAANSLGYRPDDGIGRNLRDFLSPDKRHLFDDYLRRIQEHGHDAGLMSVIARTGRPACGCTGTCCRNPRTARRTCWDTRSTSPTGWPPSAGCGHNIEQRETLTFLADFSDRLAPLVTFDELVDVVRRLPVPFSPTGRWCISSTTTSRFGSPRFTGNASHEPALAGIATALIRAGNSALRHAAP